MLHCVFEVVMTAAACMLGEQQVSGWQCHLQQFVNKLNNVNVVSTLILLAGACCCAAPSVDLRPAHI
jgi:hypothetical protein